MRDLRCELGIPEDIVGRHQSPGPGLAIRLPGGITHEKLDILRQADAIYIEEIRTAGLYDKIWQALADLLPVRTVGVMGDDWTYDYARTLRAVLSTDGMTADDYPFEHEFMAHIANRIINEVKGINRVIYDISNLKTKVRMSLKHVNIIVYMGHASFSSTPILPCLTKSNIPAADQLKTKV